MGTNAHRGGLGFEKFFRRKSSSVERTKDPEKNVKTAVEGVETPAQEEKEVGSSKVGKGFSQKGLEDKNGPADDPKTDTKQITDVSSQKTTESKKKQKSATALENTLGKPDDKVDDSEACKEYIIKDDVGQVKLTQIINNSIKEAVLNIVKEGVCPLADSLDLRAKNTSKKSPSSIGQEIHDKENKPGSPKPLLSLLSGGNKTFDSHLCQSQYHRSSQISPRSSWKLSDQRERVIQSIREASPPVNTSRKVVKCPKQKDKRVREESPKISRQQSKGQSSHFRTDNRRMTGNVNIYICSEANENAKGKLKPKNTKDCNDDSESTSGTAPSSTLSLSTSKLVAALRKKQGKNLDNQSLNCDCEPPTSSVNPYRSYSKIGDGVGNGDDLVCLCDEDSNEVNLSNTRSNSSRDVCLCEETKFSDLDFPCSDEGSLNKPFVSAATCECIAYDRDDDWPCTSEDCASYDNSSGRRRFNTLTQGDNPETDLEERRSYCTPAKCKEDRPVVVPCPRNWESQSEHRKSRDRTSRTSRDTQKFDKCLCIVEEEDENCGNDRKKSEVKFTVCGIPLADEESHGNAQNQNDDPANSLSKSCCNVSRNEEKNVRFPEAEKNDSVRNSRIASTSSHNMVDKKENPDVEGDINSKPQSPKPTLLSTLTKNFKRSSGKKNQEPKTPTETTRAEDQEKETETDKNQRNSIAPTVGDNNLSAVPNEKPKNSLFYRSIQKAMNIVKIRKDDGGEADEEGGKNKGCSSKCQAKPKNNGVEGTNGAGSKNGTCSRLCSGIDKGKFNPNSGNNLKQEKRSKSRISTAIASRRNSATTSNESSNVSLSHSEPNKTDRQTNLSTIQDRTKTQVSGQGLLSCKCGKLAERSECRCKKPEPPKDETCNCYITSTKPTSGTCCKHIIPRKESCACCPKCENPVDKCICCSKKPELIEANSCKCCPRCSRPILECKCCCSKQETLDLECCKCCLRQKHLCCCNPEGTSHANKSQVQKCAQPRNFSGIPHQCKNCCRPKAECRCCLTFSNWECPKSMICIYCDEPQENCTCKAPIRKCSQCGMPLDVCNCNLVPCYDCSGRQIVQPEGNEAQTICVTAWKPRRSVRRYFAREPNDVGDNSEEDCKCYENTKPYGSERLPYQKGSVFSNVMSELQQKISGSMCCNICRNVPCNCCTETNDQVERPKQRLSTIPEKKRICRSRNRSRSKSPGGSCKCSTPRKKSGRNMPVLRICGRCRTSPCRCRRSSVSPQNKPPAKCYYCKSSPCICAAAREPANICPFRKADSSHRRRKDCCSTEEHVNADVRNKDNGHRGRASNHVVPCPGNQQLRKYCYRGNPTGEHTLNSVERVR